MLVDMKRWLSPSCVTPGTQPWILGFQPWSLPSLEGLNFHKSLASLLGARTLLGAPGLTTRNKKLLGAPGIAKDATRSPVQGPFNSPFCNARCPVSRCPAPGHLAAKGATKTPVSNETELFFQASCKYQGRGLSHAQRLVLYQSPCQMTPKEREREGEYIGEFLKNVLHS